MRTNANTNNYIQARTNAHKYAHIYANASKNKYIEIHKEHVNIQILTNSKTQIPANTCNARQIMQYTDARINHTNTQKQKKYIQMHTNT